MKISIEKKDAILSYLGEVPVYKWAAKAVSISEDTLLKWRKDDPGFADQCEARIAEFVKKNVKKARPEFQLERLLRDDFGQGIDVTSKGEKIEGLIIVKNADKS